MASQYRSRAGSTAPRVVAVTVLVVVGMIAPVVGVGGPATVAAQTTESTVEGLADLDVSAPENRFDPGEEGTLELFVSNDGEVIDDGETHPQEAIDRATEARSVDVEVSRSAFTPVEVRTDQQSVGTIASGDTAGPTPFEIRVDDDASAGTYELDVTIEYREATSVTYERDDEGELRFRENTVERTESLTVQVHIDGEARFEVVDRDHDVTVGDTGDFEIDLENVGDEDLTDATVSVTSLDGDVVFGSDGQGSQTFVGEWDAGDSVDLTFRAAAADAAIQRAYPVEVEVTYDDESGTEQTRTLLTSLTPGEEQTFQATLVDHTVAIDDDGIMEFDIANHGPENATAASVTVSAPDGAIDIGTGAQDADLGGSGVAIQGMEIEGLDGDGGGGAGVGESEAFVGDLPAGESTTLRFLGTASDDAIEREYTLEVTIDYEDDDGNDRSDRTLKLGFQPIAEQTFDVTGVESSLHVGEDGDLRGELVNTGDRSVDGVVLQVDSGPDTLAPRESQYAVGSLDPGEAVPVDFRIGATGEAEPGPRTMEFTVRYRNVHADIRESDPIDVTAEVQPRRDRLGAQAVNGTLAAGESGVIEFDVRNNDDQTLRNVRMKIFTNSPLDSGDSEAFIPELAPGETERIAFELEADDGAVPRTYPVSMDFRFDDERNDTQMSRTQNVPIQVTDVDDDGMSLLGMGLLLLIPVVLVAVIGWRRYGGGDLPFGDDDGTGTGPGIVGDTETGTGSGAGSGSAVADEGSDLPAEDRAAVGPVTGKSAGTAATAGVHNSGEGDDFDPLFGDEPEGGESEASGEAATRGDQHREEGTNDGSGTDPTFDEDARTDGSGASFEWIDEDYDHVDDGH